MNIDAELERFNGLAAELAALLVVEIESEATPTAMRSCWYCNAAHEHLKESECKILCFVCGNGYYRSFPFPVIRQRAQGASITREEVVGFAESIDE